jgi:hypothetical protein
MAGDPIGRMALLWRGDRDTRGKTPAENDRLRPVFEALAELGITAEAAVYAEEFADEVRDQLLRVDGSLVLVGIGVVAYPRILISPGVTLSCSAGLLR